MKLNTDPPEKTSAVPPSIIKCVFCTFESQSQSNVNDHVNKEHNNTSAQKCNLCDFETSEFDMMKKHVEISHCQGSTVYMLKALSDLAAVVRVLANDILQVKADSIIVNEDVMSNIRGDMIENINENVNSKFNTVDKRIDRLFQHLLSQESTGNKDVDVNSKKSQSKENDVPVVDLSQDEPKETYASKASSHAGKQKEDTKTKKDVLVVGTSISNNLDKRVCENLTDLTIDVATAYTVGPDIDAKYREKNFKKIVPEKLKNQKYETLVLQGGSIEITNINTKDESKEMHFQSWKNKVKKSSEEMFNLAEESITAYPDLKVIIVARIPRFFERSKYRANRPTTGSYNNKLRLAI